VGLRLRPVVAVNICSTLELVAASFGIAVSGLGLRGFCAPVPQPGDTGVWWWWDFFGRNFLLLTRGAKDGATTKRVRPVTNIYGTS
jgi:hypothetical protein